MNRHCYRIIFNRARRMLVVVSELARASGGDTGRGPGCVPECVAALRPLTLALWLAGGMISAAAQAETIAPDRSAPGGQQPTVMQTGNGLPQVNIQTPNDKGLSHNKYSQFDVGERGAILNNSQHNTQTQLAGQVAGNPWLAKGSAKVILNEVNSMNPSQLRGFVEVAGQKADVIIANPAGITCSGCGFINAGRNTLAAGRVRLENGQVAGYDVDRGRITISGGGMNGTGQDYTRLIARAVDVNARLQAGDLKITTGRNQTDADGNVIQVKADDPDGRPQFAVDTASLGGMYANRITLVGTERGVGVRNAGEIGATQGGFTLNAEGKLTNSGTLYSQQDLALKTAQLDNQGHIATGGNLSVTNQGSLTNSGQMRADQDLRLDTSGVLRSEAGSSLIAGRNTTVNAQSVEADSGSAMGAGIDDNGQATRSGQLTVNAAGRLASHGTHLSRDGFTASGSEVDLSGSQNRSAAVTATARDGNLSVDGALIDADRATLSSAHAFSSRNSAIAASQLNIRAADKIDNSGGTLISRGTQGFSLSSREIDNSGGTLASAGDFTLTSSRLINTGGQLGSDNGNVTIQGGDIAGAEGKILAAKALSVSGQQIVLDGGLTQGQQVNLQGETLSLQNAHLLQTGDGEAQIGASGLLNTRGGLIESAGAMTLSAGSMDNTEGRIASNGNLGVRSGDLDNTSGTLIAQRLDIHADALTNRQGTLEGLQTVAIDAGSLDSQQGFISADGGDASLSVSGDIDNRGGNLQSAKNLFLSGNALDNQSGRVLAAGGQLQAGFTGSVNNGGGRLIAQQLALSAGELNNHQGAISAASGGSALDLSGAFDNSGGTLESADGLTLNAASLDNTAGRIATPGALNVDLHGGSLINARTDADGLGLLSGQTLTLYSGDLNNLNGNLQARNLILNAGNINNQSGYLGASESLTLKGTSLNNADGLLSADGGAASLSLTGALANRQGTLQSQQAMNLNAASLDNDGGKILSAKSQVNGAFSGALSNRGGSVLAGTALELRSASLDNQQGIIAATHGDSRLTTGALNNQSGDIESSQRLTVDAGQLDNSGGQLLASDAMEVVSDGLINDGGLIQARNALAIDTRGGALSNTGTLTDSTGIRSGGLLTLTAGDVDNQGGLISGESLTAQGKAWNNQGGELSSAGDLSLSGASLNNAQGLVSASEGALTASLAQDLNNQRGTLQSGQSLGVSAGSVNNSDGALLAAGGSADVRVQDAFNNQRGELLARNDVRLNAGDVDNQGGRVSALNGGAFIGAAAGILNQGGIIDAASALQLKGDRIANAGGQIVASGGALAASAREIANQSGRMAAQGDLQIDGQTLDNSDGTLTSVEGQLRASLADTINNQRGVVQSGHDVLLQGGALDNREGTVLAVDGVNRIAVDGALLNGGGEIASQQAVELRAGSVDNQNGTVSSQTGALNVSVDGLLNNQQGALEGAGPVEISAGSLNNRSGSLLSAADNLAVSVAQGLDNQGGQIAARRGVTLAADDLNNVQGMVTAVEGPLTVNGGQRLDNTDGTLQSTGDLNLSAASLTNQRGTLQSTAGDSTLSLTGGLNNQQGFVSAGNRLTLNGAEMDNRDGVLVAKHIDLTSQALTNRNGLIQGSDALTINTQGNLLDNSGTNGDSTGLRSGGSLSLSTGGLNNQGGLIAANALTVSGQDVDNRQGLINSTGDSQLTTGDLNNQSGVIQSGGSISLDTRGAGVHNEQGTLLADKILTLSAGALGNAQGLIQGGAGLTVVGSQLDNGRGQLLSGGGLTTRVDSLNNDAGLIYAAGDADVSASQDLRNQQGLIKADGALTVSAAQLDNQNTRGSGQGIEARDLTLNAASLNNQSGVLRAGDTLQANVSEGLNNQSGLISSQNSLTIGQPGQRPALANGGGDIVANGDASLWLGQIDGVGRITGGGSLSLDVASALNQDGSLAAGNDLTLNTNGNALTNAGSINAGNQLTLNSGHLDNLQSGDINAGTTRVNASDILNQGLIDGGDVLIRTGDLHNTGTGRIYGDRLAIDARTLLNDKAGDTAATIAAREDLVIATDRLVNQDHGLIYSNGGLSIGGALNEAGELSGQASQVENLSATIEAMGDLRIDAVQTENRDIHLTVSDSLQNVSVSDNMLEVELCSGREWPEGCGRIDGQHYRFNGHVINYEQGETSNVAFDFDQDGRSYALDAEGNRITVNVNGQDEYVYLWQDTANDIIWFNLPGVTDAGRRFDVFSFTRSVKEQAVSGQDSAVIRSGGNLLLNGGLHNKDSQVVAGQDLTINGNVNNDETTVRQEITDDGVVIRAGKRKEHKETHFEGQGAYQPPLQEIDLPLHLTVQQQGQGPADGRTIDGQKPTNGGGEQAAGLNGGAELMRRDDRTLVTEVALPPGQSVDTQLRPVNDTLTDSADHSPSDLQRRSGADGLVDVALSGAGGLTTGATGSLNGTVGNAQLDGTQSGAPTTVPAGQDNWVLRSVTGPVKVPDSSLFVLHPGTDSNYLVETDPRFTQGKKALSSGDFYSQDQLQKRLGDGYYEQSLVRDQIVKATGQRYLSGYSDDEEQYRALLSSGKSFTERFGIAPGVDLTPEQMLQVTSDMVIMVNQTVTLPDGSTQVVSVPKVYARVKPGDLKGDGALLSGNNVRINTAGDVINSGTIQGRDLTAISAGNLLNTGDISGNRTQLVATNDIVNRSGQLKGGDQLILQSGHDIINETESYRKGSEGWLGRQAVITVTNDKGELSVEAGHDIHMTASQLSNQGKDSKTRVVAGNDITMDTAGISHATDYTRNRNNYDRTLETREIGTLVSTTGDLFFQTGHDFNAKNADVTAGGSITGIVGNDMNLMSGTDTWDQSSSAKWTKHGTFSKTTTRITSEVHQSKATGNNFSGDTIDLFTGNDFTTEASNFVSTRDTLISVGGNFTAKTAAEKDHAFFSERRKKSGISGSGGLGVTAGSSSQKTTNDDTSNVQKGNVFGSSEGNLTIRVKNAITSRGSDYISGGDTTIQGKSVDISGAENSHTSLTTYESKSHGVTLAVSGTVGSALNTATEQLKSAREEEDSRLAALKGTQAVLTGIEATQAGRLAAVSDDPRTGNYAGIALSYGSQKSKSENRLEERTAVPANVQAGGNVSVSATGGDVRLENIRVKSGGDTSVSASDNIYITSGTSTRESSVNNSSHGGSLGLGVAAGSGSAGISVSASANRGKGHENGKSVTRSESEVDAGGTFSFESGNDTVLSGFVGNAGKIVGNVGGNLLMSSEQDSSQYNLRQSNTSAGASVTWGAGASGSGSFSASRDKMTDNFNSVQEQTGLHAGEGGVQLTVGGESRFNGIVITSGASEDKNIIDTGTLVWDDIYNSEDSDVSTLGAGISSGGVNGKDFLGNVSSNTLVAVNGSNHTSSITHTAVDDGTIIIRDTANQKQDVNTLSHDTAHAANSLSPEFDKEKELRRLQEAHLIAEIGTQVANIAYTEGQIAGYKAKKDPEALAKAKAELIAEAAQKGKVFDGSSDAIAQRAYDNAMKSWGTGSALQQGIQAATAAIQGLAGGDLASALAGGAAPYLAEIIHQKTMDPVSGTENKEANLIAHAVLGAAVALAQGNNALAGAAGGSAGEATAMIAMSLYDKKVSELTEDEKQRVSTLGTLAAGLAGGLAGGDVSSVISGAQAGKNAVENNYLGKVLVEGCAIAAPCRTKVAEQLLEIGVKAGITGVVAKEIADKISAEELDHLITLKMTGNDEITSKYLGLLEGKYGSSNTGGNQIVDSGPTNTGGNQTATGNIPSHTGNNQSSGQGATNTGNTDGKPDTGGNTTVTPIPDGPSADDLAYLSNNKNAIEDSWHQGSFGSSEDSLQKHYEKHGKEVGATSTEQYLRKAQAFADDLKGARKTNISGATEGVTRYYKNGKYIDIAGNGKIISFGKQ